MLTTHHATTVQIVINERKSQGDLPFTRIGPRFYEGYIIPSNSSFQTSSESNKHSRKLVEAARKHFYGDTMNIFGHEDQKF